MKVVAVCFALSLAMLSAARLDGPSEHEAAQDVADELEVREACGENGTAVTLPDGRVQCLTKHGKKVEVKK